MVVLVSVFAIVTALAAFAMPLGVKEKRTVIQIKTDVIALGTDINDLSSAIDAFQSPGGTIMQLTAITANALMVGTTLNQLAIDAANTPGLVDEADALSIIGIIQGIQPVVTTALVNVAAKKTDLEALLPGTVGAGVVDTLVAAALIAFSTIFNSAASGLIAITPPDLLGTAVGIETAIANGFSTAIATFRPLL